MDLRQYYQKLRDCEGRIAEAFVVVVSRETGDGGREGVKTEVPRAMAARLVTEGRARLATGEETEAFRAESAEAMRAAERLALTGKVQMAVMSDSEVRAIRSALGWQQPA